MSIKDYKECLFRTLTEVYPIYLKKKILRKMSEDDIIINDKRKTLNGQLNMMMINVSDIDGIEEKLKYILEYDNESLDKKIHKYIEEFEYDKEYRHACFFEVEGYNEELLPCIIKEGKANIFIKTDEAYDCINDKFFMPTIKDTQDTLYIKFNHKLTNRQGEEIKYVIMAIIHKKHKLLEIRFDRVGGEYKEPANDFYAFIINKTIEAVKGLLNIQINNIDFKAIIDYMKDEKEDVCIYAQKMTRNGSVAYLEALNNKDKIGSEELVIPILGEFKVFVNNNEELFNKFKDTMEIKKKLESLIDEIEVTSDLPKVKINWINEGIKLGIDHEYKGNEYSFFMYYDELKEGKERMDHVREYLIECYRELKDQT
ncbi:hypothetical protein ABE450_001911 [Clostridium perfringens]